MDKKRFRKKKKPTEYVIMTERGKVTTHRVDNAK